MIAAVLTVYLLILIFPELLFAHHLQYRRKPIVRRRHGQATRASGQGRCIGPVPVLPLSADGQVPHGRRRGSISTRSSPGSSPRMSSSRRIRSTSTGFSASIRTRCPGVRGWRVAELGLSVLEGRFRDAYFCCARLNNGASDPSLSPPCEGRARGGDGAGPITRPAGWERPRAESAVAPCHAPLSTREKRATKPKGACRCSSPSFSTREDDLRTTRPGVFASPRNSTFSCNAH